MQKILIVIGILLVLMGLTWPFIKKLGLGRLPGDIVIRKGQFTFYLPITTCIILSILITIIIWLMNR
ncbi:DUF2905 domain-containing protein [Legionella impletisoli]|uniref:DUF2905 domain-containing protein n=1 Tax=Legionella impletisoli TaxID=343510 RepID=A0A917N7P0_9GAMM|nr:DUF2905 domain-containing protein [Legionella impletisoli]GGI75471.1 hypothetical protein GCM10007966_00340 [Legionella impletisoli]